MSNGEGRERRLIDKTRACHKKRLWKHFGPSLGYRHGFRFRERKNWGKGKSCT
jgi:hypothetical protein